MSSEEKQAPKPWTMELSKLSISRQIRYGQMGLLIVAQQDLDAGIYVFVPIREKELAEGNVTFVLNILSADLTNAFQSILWMWNNPEDAEHDGYLDPNSATRIRAWREKK